MIRSSATGVIVALAVIWGGGTWYTGTQIQPGVEKFIKDFNYAKKKGEHAYDMTLSYQNFDKGFFHSRFQMQMHSITVHPISISSQARKLYLMWMLSTVRCPSQC
ncbi:DUF945 family protein [Shigella flexneri]